MNRSYLRMSLVHIVLLVLYPSFMFSQSILTHISAKKNILTIEPTPYLKETFLSNQSFNVTYDRTIQGLPQTILAIPYIMCMSPLLWLSGKIYTIPEMDHDTYYALEEIKKVFKIFYPNFSFEGSLQPKRLIKNSPPHKQTGSHVALLFSGGLDCVSSSLGLMGHHQLLITNRGVDIPLKNGSLWENVQDQCRTFAQTYDHANAFISCNFCTILNYSYLKVFSPMITKWWWLDSVVDALNHTGITAPLLYSLGYTKLYIAASHTIDHPYPYGSHPLIDNRIAFGGITVHHDQEGLDRCQKIELIKSVSKVYNKPIPSLRVCWSDTEGYNCLSCEKCLRTLNNCIVTGNIPLDYGFTIAQEEAMYRTRQFLGTDPINTSKLFWEWSVIQKRARKRLKKDPTLSEEDREYLHWLSNIKLDGKHAEQIHKNDFQKGYFAWLWNTR